MTHIIGFLFGFLPDELKQKGWIVTETNKTIHIYYAGEEMAQVNSAVAEKNTIINLIWLMEEVMERTKEVLAERGMPE